MADSSLGLVGILEIGHQLHVGLERKLIFNLSDFQSLSESEIFIHLVLGERWQKLRTHLYL